MREQWRHLVVRSWKTAELVVRRGLRFLASRFTVDRRQALAPHLQVPVRTGAERARLQVVPYFVDDRPGGWVALFRSRGRLQINAGRFARLHYSVKGVLGCDAVVLLVKYILNLIRYYWLKVLLIEGIIDWRYYWLKILLLIEDII